VRLGAMGDVIHTLPAVAALRGAFPSTPIGWIIEERWAELLCAKDAARFGPTSPARPLADYVHVVNTKRWRHSPLARATRRQMYAVRKELINQHYEIAADFQGAVKSAILASFAKARIGMAHPRETPARLLYHRRVRTSGSHVIEQYHSLAEALAGKRLPPGRAELPCDRSAEAQIGTKLKEWGENFVLINPGAGWATKQWPAERYGRVARVLAQAGFTVLVNAGPGEQELAESVRQASSGAAIAISGSLAELIALTRRAKLFIGGDTGPMHLAAALQVPVVGLFGPTDPARNGPCGTQSVVLRDPSSPTSLSHTNTPDPGLLNITVDEVVSAARKLVEDSHAELA
jgi:heptosyltransferase I